MTPPDGVDGDVVGAAADRLEQLSSRGTQPRSRRTCGGWSRSWGRSRARRSRRSASRSPGRRSRRGCSRASSCSGATSRFAASGPRPPERPRPRERVECSLERLPRLEAILRGRQRQPSARRLRSATRALPFLKSKRLGGGDGYGRYASTDAHTASTPADHTGQSAECGACNERERSEEREQERDQRARDSFVAAARRASRVALRAPRGEGARAGPGTARRAIRAATAGSRPRPGRRAPLRPRRWRRAPPRATTGARHAPSPRPAAARARRRARSRGAARSEAGRARLRRGRHRGGRVWRRSGLGARACATSSVQSSPISSAYRSGDVVSRRHSRRLEHCRSLVASLPRNARPGAYGRSSSKTTRRFACSFV